MSKNCVKVATAFLLITLCYLCTGQVSGENTVTVPASVYIAETESDPNVQAVTDAVKAMPLTKQKEFFAQYLTYNYPINLPGFWKLVTEPDQGLRMVAHFAEPYNPNILDMLERILPKASHQQGLPIAAILYRYNRTSGYTYLSNLLDEDADFQAALIFAFNKDDSKLPQILKILTAYEDLIVRVMHSDRRPDGVKLPLSTEEKVQLRDDDDYELELVSELSSWHDPRIAPVLYKIFHQQPKKSYLSMALAEQNYRDAVPMIRMLYFSEPSDSPAKVDAGAALVKLDGKRANQILDFLTVGLRQRHNGIDVSENGLDVSEMEEVAYRDFGFLKIDAATPTLKGVIENYISPNTSVSSPPNDQLTRPIELAVVAAESLAKIDDKSSTQLVARLLSHYMQTQTQSDLLFRIANSALLLEVPDKEMGKLMGEKWVRRKMLTNRLTPLPHYLLPY